jgi:hypothetical protein
MKREERELRALRQEVKHLRLALKAVAETTGRKGFVVEVEATPEGTIQAVITGCMVHQESTLAAIIGQSIAAVLPGWSVTERAE